ALCDARKRAAKTGRDADAAWPGRPRFINAMREIGAAALPAFAAAMVRIELREDALAEDLLLGAPFLRHASPAVRRAAVVAVASLRGAAANPWIAPLLEEPDDDLRLTVIA